MHLYSRAGSRAATCLFCLCGELCPRPFRLSIDRLSTRGYGQDASSGRDSGTYSREASCPFVGDSDCVFNIFVCQHESMHNILSTTYHDILENIPRFATVCCEVRNRVRRSTIQPAQVRVPKKMTDKRKTKKVQPPGDHRRDRTMRNRRTTSKTLKQTHHPAGEEHTCKQRSPAPT